MHVFLAYFYACMIYLIGARKFAAAGKLRKKKLRKLAEGNLRQDLLYIYARGHIEHVFMLNTPVFV